jgi:hypothetical protein
MHRVIVLVRLDEVSDGESALKIVVSDHGHAEMSNGRFPRVFNDLQLAVALEQARQEGEIDILMLRMEWSG